MKNRSTSKPACIASAEVEAIAREGVERGLAARRAMTELSQEIAGQVGGGLTLVEQLKLIGPIRGGGMIGPVDIFSTEMQR